MALASTLRATVLVIATGAVVLAGCTQAAAPGGPATAEPSASPAAATTVVAVPRSVQEIPGQPPVIRYGTVDDPQLGMAYEYHLYVHCGIRDARFGGRWWKSIVLTNSQEFLDDGSGYVAGSMTLVEPTLARFEWDGQRADFVPTSVEPQPCA